jgi:hypothetical protein
MTKIYNIKYTRGDTHILSVQIERDGKCYIPEAGDKIYFSLRDNIPKDSNVSSEYIFQKVYPENGIYFNYEENTINVLIASEDTKNLLISPKKYYYDLQINFSSGEVKTYLKGEFELGYEITI